MECGKTADYGNQKNKRQQRNLVSGNGMAGKPLAEIKKQN